VLRSAAALPAVATWSVPIIPAWATWNGAQIISAASRRQIVLVQTDFILALTPKVIEGRGDGTSSMTNNAGLRNALPRAGSCARWIKLL
jgi:hypothetical protein